MLRLTFILLLLFFTGAAFAGLPLGEVPPLVVLKDDSGSKMDGSPWSSKELISAKLHVLFYADPDEGGKNSHVDDALKAENFSPEKYTTVAILNMAATWIPDAVINFKLKSRQEEDKSTVFVKDLEKTLVQQWGLKDDESNIMLFGKDGKLLYSGAGKFTENQVQELLKIIRDELAKTL